MEILEHTVTSVLKTILVTGVQSTIDDVMEPPECAALPKPRSRKGLTVLRSLRSDRLEDSGDSKTVATPSGEHSGGLEDSGDSKWWFRALEGRRVAESPLVLPTASDEDDSGREQEDEYLREVRQLQTVRQVRLVSF